MPTTAVIHQHLHVAAGRTARAVSDNLECVGNPTTDVTVTSLPYRAGEERGAAEVLTAVRHAADALVPGQTAVVLGPADILVDALPPHQSAARRRNELLATGLVEAIIQLPGGSFRSDPDTGPHCGSYAGRNRPRGGAGCCSPTSPTAR